MVEACHNHRIRIESGLLADAFSQMLREFFRSRRQIGSLACTGGSIPSCNRPALAKLV